jgi:hypothetical protein
MKLNTVPIEPNSIPIAVIIPIKDVIESFGVPVPVPLLLFWAKV